MRTLLYVAATGMAAFFDFSIGMFTVFVIGNVMGVPVLWWYLPIAGKLNLLPDFDLVFQRLRTWFKGEPMMGDHRDTFMHVPIIMLPCCTLIAFVIGGTFWALTTFFCLLNHYLHDSKVFSCGDIDWLGTGKKLPYMDTPEWLEKFWLRPSATSVLELIVGCFLLEIVLKEYIGLGFATKLVFAIMGANVMVWFFAARFRSYC